MFLSRNLHLWLLTLYPVSSHARFTYPLASGFPNISDPAVVAGIERSSGGHYGTYPAAPSLTNDSITAWTVLAFGALFEVAFFNELHANVTRRVPGYDDDDDADAFFAHPSERKHFLRTLDKLQAIGQLHYFDGEWADVGFGGYPVLPPSCGYAFPVSSLASAVDFAATFTWLALGNYADFVDRTIGMGEPAAAGIAFNIAGWAGQAGQQSGWLRSLQRRGRLQQQRRRLLPSAQPVPTPVSRELLYSWYRQHGPAEGLCNGSADAVGGGGGNGTSALAVPVYAPLELATETVVDGPIAFEFDADASAESVSPASHSLVYINGNMAPFTVPFDVVPAAAAAAAAHDGKKGMKKEKKKKGNRMRITAHFPHDRLFMDGLTIAAVARGQGPFAFPKDLANATVFGPAVIEWS